MLTKDDYAGVEKVLLPKCPSCRLEVHYADLLHDRKHRAWHIECWRARRTRHPFDTTPEEQRR